MLLPEPAARRAGHSGPLAFGDVWEDVPAAALIAPGGLSAEARAARAGAEDGDDLEIDLQAGLHAMVAAVLAEEAEANAARSAAPDWGSGAFEDPGFDALDFDNLASADSALLDLEAPLLELDTDDSGLEFDELDFDEAVRRARGRPAACAPAALLPGGARCLPIGLLEEGAAQVGLLMQDAGAEELAEAETETELDLVLSTDFSGAQPPAPRSAAPPLLGAANASAQNMCLRDACGARRCR